MKCKQILREDALTRYTMGYEIDLKYLPKDDSAPQEEYEYTELYNWLLEHENVSIAIGGALIIAFAAFATIVSGGVSLASFAGFVPMLNEIFKQVKECPA